MPRAAAITASRRVHSATASTPSSAQPTTIMTTTAATFRRRGTRGRRHNITASTDLTGVIRAIRPRRRAILTDASTKHRSVSIQATFGAIGDIIEKHLITQPLARRLARCDGGIYSVVSHANLQVELSLINHSLTPPPRRLP